MHGIDVSTGKLDENLAIVTFQWTMIFNPGASKQAQEVIFRLKIKKPLLFWSPTILLCIKLAEKVLLP